jgi:hypothetical protein
MVSNPPTKSPAPSRVPTSVLVEQYYCRVLQRPPNDEENTWGVDYLKDNSVKDLVRLGILGDEFEDRFVDGKSNETLVHTLYDVLLAREGEAGGFANWVIRVGKYPWKKVVDGFLASDEYKKKFGNDAVPGGGRPGCSSRLNMRSDHVPDLP